MSESPGADWLIPVAKVTATPRETHARVRRQMQKTREWPAVGATGAQLMHGGERCPSGSTTALEPPGLVQESIPTHWLQQRKSCS